MYKYLFKKSFFDGWDNMLFQFLTNAIFVAPLLLLIVLPPLYVLPVFLIVYCVNSLGVAGSAYNITRNNGKCFDGYKTAMKKIKHLVFFFILTVLVAFIVGFVVPAYFSFNSFFGLCLGFLMLFIGIGLVMMLMYYFPLCMELPDDKPATIFKKCFICFVDNLGFSFFCTVINIIDVAVSSFTLLLMPGVAATKINTNNAVYFIMAKYDWIKEKNVSKRKVPADECLSLIMEPYEGRNLQTLIFPYKQIKK